MPAPHSPGSKIIRSDLSGLTHEATPGKFAQAGANVQNGDFLLDHWSSIHEHYLLFGNTCRQSFKNLYDTTNWGPLERDVEFYADASRGSWASVAAYDGDSLVAFARAISDGKLHAFITEMIVDPACQRRRLGEQLLKLIVERCHSSGVKDIQLFCAMGKADFYLKNGFSRRPDDAPGMQYSGAG